MTYDTMSVHINTDRTHTVSIDDEMGWPEGSVALTFYRDTVGNVPGDQADIGMVLSEITFPAIERFADKFDGWYMLHNRDNITQLPEEFKDGILVFLTQHGVTTRLIKAIDTLVMEFPNKEQVAMIKGVRDLCIAIVFGQNLILPIQVWPVTSVPDGYLLMGKNGKPLPVYYTTREEARNASVAGQYVAEVKLDASPSHHVKLLDERPPDTQP